MTTTRIASLHIYPIKSCAGFAVERAETMPRGLRTNGISDRRWVLVDATGLFQTQRQLRHMARIKINPTGTYGSILATYDSLPPLVIDPGKIDQPTEIEIWHNKLPAHTTSSIYDDWFSAALGKSVKLVYQTDEDLRFCSPVWAGANDRPTSFADGNPYLIVNQATLNTLPVTVPMNRFRPNIVLNTSEAGIEYKHRVLRVNDINFNLVKPCTRCVMTTIDQELGVITGPEPYATLCKTESISITKQEKSLRGPVFGMTALSDCIGTIAVNDAALFDDAHSGYQFGALKTLAVSAAPY